MRTHPERELACKAKMQEDPDTTMGNRQPGYLPKEFWRIPHQLQAVVITQHCEMHLLAKSPSPFFPHAVPLLQYVGAMFGRTQPWEVWGPSGDIPEVGTAAVIDGLRKVRTNLGEGGV